MPAGGPPAPTSSCAASAGRDRRQPASSRGSGPWWTTSRGARRSPARRFARLTSAAVAASIDGGPRDRRLGLARAARPRGVRHRSRSRRGREHEGRAGRPPRARRRARARGRAAGRRARGVSPRPNDGAWRARASRTRCVATGPRAPEAAATPADTLTREIALIDAARGELVTAPARALAALETHRRAFPRGELAAEREFLAVEALRRMNRTDEARRRADDLQIHYPTSSYAARASRLLPVGPLTGGGRAGWRAPT